MGAVSAFVYNISMQYFSWLACAFLFFLTACQPHSSSVTIIDGDQIQHIETSETELTPLLEQAGVVLGANDRIFVNGIEAPLDQTRLVADTLTIQIRRAVSIDPRHAAGTAND